MQHEPHRSTSIQRLQYLMNPCQARKESISLNALWKGHNGDSQHIKMQMKTGKITALMITVL